MNSTGWSISVSRGIFAENARKESTIQVTISRKHMDQAAHKLV